MEALRLEPRDLVDARLFANEDEVVQVALRHLLQDRPELRLNLAVHIYESDEDVSLARAAAVAGVSSMGMRDILAARGVPLRLGPANIEEAKAEIAALRQALDGRNS